MAFLWLLSCLALLRVSSVLGEPASQPELSIMSRIINGKDARPGSWPWHVVLMSRDGIPLCGGVLINSNWVMTAAHCNVTRSYRAVVGLHILNSTGHFQELRISQIFRYPRFNPSTLYGDIALLKLRTGPQFSSKVTPLRLPRIDDQFLRCDLCKIMGLGYTHPNDTMYSHKLKEATVSIVRDEMCKIYWGEIDTEVMLCAGFRGVSPTQGDAGGSLACRKNGVWTLAGIVSFFDDFTTSKPFVVTRVTAFLPWIKKTLAKN